jgi:hypothetical protein
MQVNSDAGGAEPRPGPLLATNLFNAVSNGLFCLFDTFLQLLDAAMVTDTRQNVLREQWYVIRKPSIVSRYVIKSH